MTAPDLDGDRRAGPRDRGRPRVRPSSSAEHFDGLMVREPGARHLPRHPRPGPPAGRPVARGVPRGHRGRSGATRPPSRRSTPPALSPATAFERELALFGVRRARFDAEVHRAWERRARAADEIGDALFLLFARHFAPLPERLEAITERLVAAPGRAAAGPRPARRPARRACGSSWSSRRCASLPGVRGRRSSRPDPARGVRTTRARRRLARPRRTPSTAMARVRRRGSRSQLPRAGDDFALGRADLETLIALRAFDGLDGDAILAIGLEQLELQHRGARGGRARRWPARPGGGGGGSGQVRTTRPRSRRRSTGYRDAMHRARAFIVAHDLATVPAGRARSTWCPRPSTCAR